MKTQTIRNVSLALLAAASIFAQGPSRMTAKVPFVFHVGDTMFPAGEYTVDTGAGRDLVRVKAADTSQAVMLLSYAVGQKTRETKPQLIFNRYGDQYFLSQVWTPSGNKGLQLHKTKREIQEARNTNPGIESVMAAK